VPKTGQSLRGLCAGADHAERVGAGCGQQVGAQRGGQAGAPRCDSGGVGQREQFSGLEVVQAHDPAQCWGGAGELGVHLHGVRLYAGQKSRHQTGRGTRPGKVRTDTQRWLLGDRCAESLAQDLHDLPHIDETVHP
jgi:hypothetical protein